MGEQPESFEGSCLFVVPNPSGLNAHETTSTLAEAYRRAAIAAGIVPER
jgi:TDG/mug DNA glycosylase family protein